MTAACVKHYYKIAPIIVEKIDKDNIVDYCVKQIENENYTDNCKRYEDSILVFKRTYTNDKSKKEYYDK